MITALDQTIHCGKPGVIPYIVVGGMDYHNQDGGKVRKFGRIW